MASENVAHIGSATLSTPGEIASPGLRTRPTVRFRVHEMFVAARESGGHEYAYLLRGTLNAIKALCANREYGPVLVNQRHH
jgi:hypothetical protein